MAPASAYAWAWPAEGPVLRPFTLGADPYAGGQHRGIDIGGDLGAKVRAAAGGKVTFVGKVPGSGLVVSIATEDGYAVTLTHLGSASVGKGSTIDEGAAVGTIGSGSDGEIAVPYVHLGIRVASDEHGYVDPLRFLPARVAPAPPAAGRCPCPGSVAVAGRRAGPAPAPAPAPSRLRLPRPPQFRRRLPAPSPSPVASGSSPAPSPSPSPSSDPPATAPSVSSPAAAQATAPPLAAEPTATGPAASASAEGADTASVATTPVPASARRGGDGLPPRPPRATARRGRAPGRRAKRTAGRRRRCASRRNGEARRIDLAPRSVEPRRLLPHVGGISSSGRDELPGTARGARESPSGRPIVRPASGRPSHETPAAALGATTPRHVVADVGCERAAWRSPVGPLRLGRQPRRGTPRCARGSPA